MNVVEAKTELLRSETAPKNKGVHFPTQICKIFEIFKSLTLQLVEIDGHSPPPSLTPLWTSPSSIINTCAYIIESMDILVSNSLLYIGE